MKTSKIKEIKEVKEWDGGNGAILYHSLMMENSDKIQIGKKSLQSVGTELIYEITGDDQYEYRKAKSVTSEYKNTPGNTVDLSTDFNVNNSILYQVALKGVMAHYTATHNPQFEETFTAKGINAFALEIAQFAKENIKKLKG